MIRYSTLAAATLLISTFAAAEPSSFRHTYVFLPDPFEWAPGELTTPISEHSLQWPSMLRNYLWYTGDEAFVRSMVTQHLPDWFGRCKQLEHADGLLAPSAIAADQSGWKPDALLSNVVYYAALRNAAALQEYFGQSSSFIRVQAEHLWAALQSRVAATAPLSYELAAAFAVYGAGGAHVFDAQLPMGSESLDSGSTPPALLPIVAEATFHSGHVDAAKRLLHRIGGLEPGESDHCGVPGHHAGAGTLHWCNPPAPGPAYLLTQYVYGIHPAAPGWTRVRFAPSHAPNETQAIEIGVPAGRISVRPAPGIGYAITTPVGTPVEVQSPGGTGVVTKARLSHTAAQLTPAHRAILSAALWADRLGDRPGIWISAAEQVLRVIQGETIVFQACCATALKGLGSEMNSLKTPLGWHEIRGKIGENAPWGQVFRARRPTNEVWQYGEDTKEDLVLTRVLLLDGLEPGLNKGGNVDSMARNIYIHGTNDEAKLGQPSSHGCIRMFNDEVIELFERVEDGTLVLITAE